MEKNILSSPFEKKMFLTIAAVIISYMTISLVCDLVCFRLILVGSLFFGGSALLYPALYPLLDILARILGSKITIILILFFHIADLVFSYIPILINQLPYPHNFTHHHEFNVVFSPLPRMFWAGIVGSILAGITEVIIYKFFQNKIKSFFLAALIATTLILFAHNVPVDLIAYRKLYPDNYIEIVFINTFVGLVMLGFYAFSSSRIIAFLEKSRKKNQIPLG